MSRHELKEQDEITTSIQSFSEVVYSRKKEIITGVSILAVVILAVVGWRAYASNRDANAQTMLSQAINAYNDPAIKDGEQRRDFVWVGEVIDQMRWVAAHRAPDTIYNAGTGVASTFLEMIGAWFAARGESPRIELVPMPPDLSKQYQNYTKADISTLRGAGYDRPPVLPMDGVARTLAEIAELRR